MASKVVGDRVDGGSPRRISPIRVLLVGNYLRDAQESMQRFAEAMLAGLLSQGVDARLIRPAIVLGRYGASSQSGLGKWLGYVDKFLIFPRRLARELDAWRRTAALRGELADIVVHICDHSNAAYTRHLQEVAHVVTCHDMLAVRSAHGEIPQNPTRWSGRRLQAIILHGLDRARHVACVSQATERDLLRISRLRGDRVSVIANSLNYEYSPMPASEACASVEATCRRFHPVGPGPNFVLHVGGNQWYKNRIGALRIYARLVATDAAAPALILIGEALTDEMHTFVCAQGLEDRVFRIPSCGNDELRAFYSAAGALLFPSLAEGFGWPVIEAQACGCPVVCSSMDPFPEVAGDGACLRDPADEAGFAGTLRQLIDDSVFRNGMIAKGAENARRFEPAAMVSKYVDCYADLANAAVGATNLGAPAASLLAV